VEERYSETPHEDRFTNKKGEQHFHRYTTAQLTLQATFRLTDVTTGTLLLARRFSAERKQGPADTAQKIASSVLGAVFSQLSDQSTDITDDPPDRAALERDACAEVVGKFVAAIQPTTRMEVVEFATDSAVPQLEAGIGWAQHGDWRKAQDVFNTAIQDSERNPKIGAGTLSKVYFNAALSYEYAGEHEKALTLLDRAYPLSGGNKRILDEMDNVKRMQAEAKKVAEQTASDQR
jgi:tetratricopeptide (TPR) repeat protein